MPRVTRSEVLLGLPQFGATLLWLNYSFRIGLILIENLHLSVPQPTWHAQLAAWIFYCSCTGMQLQ
jgi:hypothetical protein